MSYLSYTKENSYQLPAVTGVMVVNVVVGSKKLGDFRYN